MKLCTSWLNPARTYVSWSGAQRLPHNAIRPVHHRPGGAALHGSSKHVHVGKQHVPRGVFTAASERNDWGLSRALPGTGTEQQRMRRGNTREHPRRFCSRRVQTCVTPLIFEWFCADVSICWSASWSDGMGDFFRVYAVCKTFLQMWCGVP